MRIFLLPLLLLAHPSHLIGMLTAITAFLGAVAGLVKLLIVRK